MNQSLAAAARLKNATETVKVLTKLCLRHPDLRPRLRQAAQALKDALLDLQGTLGPILPQRPLPAPPTPRLAACDSYEQGTRAKALLLEIILRAASDWVLYRTHKKMMFREWANHAQIWLFEEGPDHQNWKERRKNEKLLTGFVSICEALDFDPDLVRRHIRKLTPQRIVSMGRPAEYRRRRTQAEYADTSDVKNFFSSVM